MKRKFLCLILCAFLCFGAVLLNACDKGGYKLSNFNADYEAIAKDYKYASYNNGYIEFDLTEIEQALNGNEEETNSFYKPLNNYYLTLTKNSLEFIRSAKVGLKEANKVSKGTRNEIKSQLDDLKTSVAKVDNQLEEFNKILKGTPAKDASRYTYYDLLTDAFVGFYDNCRTLSTTIADVYFGMLPNQNYNYYENQEGFDSTLKNSLNRLTNYQIFNLTQNYVEMYVDGGDSAKIAGSFNLYKQDIDALNDWLTKFNADPTVGFKNVEDAKALAVKLYNLNSKVLNEKEMYLQACNNVVYSQALDQTDDYVNANSVMIIAGYGETLKEYTSVLIDLYKNLLETAE